jgi:hypothetical protein
LLSFTWKDFYNFTQSNLKKKDLRRFNEYDDLFGIKEIFQIVFEIYDEKQTQKFMIKDIMKRAWSLL